MRSSAPNADPEQRKRQTCHRYHADENDDISKVHVLTLDFISRLTVFLGKTDTRNKDKIIRPRFLFNIKVDSYVSPRDKPAGKLPSPALPCAPSNRAPAPWRAVDRHRDSPAAAPGAAGVKRRSFRTTPVNQYHHQNKQQEDADGRNRVFNSHDNNSLSRPKLISMARNP